MEAIKLPKKGTRKRKQMCDVISTHLDNTKKVCRSKTAKYKSTVKGQSKNAQQTVTSDDPISNTKMRQSVNKSTDKAVVTEPTYDFPLSQASKYIPTFGKKAAVRKIEAAPLSPVAEHLDSEKDISTGCTEKDVESKENKSEIDVEINRESYKSKLEIKEVVESVPPMNTAEDVENGDISGAIITNSKNPLEMTVQERAQHIVAVPAVNHDSDFINNDEKATELLATELVQQNGNTTTGDMCQLNVSVQNIAGDDKSKHKENGDAFSACAGGTEEDLDELEKAIIEELTEEEKQDTEIESIERVENTVESATVVENVENARVVLSGFDQCSSSVKTVQQVTSSTIVEQMDNENSEKCVNYMNKQHSTKESDDIIDDMSSKDFADENFMEKCTTELKSALDECIKLTDSQLCEFDSEMLPPEMPCKITHPAVNLARNKPVSEGSTLVKQLISELTCVNQMLIRYRHEIQQMKLQVQKGRGQRQPFTRQLSANGK